MKLGSREEKEIWAKLGTTYSLNYKATFSNCNKSGAENLTSP